MKWFPCLHVNIQRPKPSNSCMATVLYHYPGPRRLLLPSLCQLNTDTKAVLWKVASEFPLTSSETSHCLTVQLSLLTQDTSLTPTANTIVQTINQLN